MNMSKRKPRDLRLDTFRGLFLVLMTLNHLPWTKTPITGEPWGFVSAAEGFVFLSGMVSGLVYGRYIIQRGFAFGCQKILARARKTYKYYLATVVALVALAQAVPAMHAAWVSPLHPLGEAPLRALLLSLCFFYQPAFCDILPMYVLFMLFSPWLLRGMVRGRGPWIMLGSMGLWMAAQFGATDRIVALFGNLWARHGIFDLLGWQILYVGGLYLGVRQGRGQGFAVMKHPWFFGLCALVTLACIPLRHRIGLHDPGLINTMIALANKNELAPLRLLDFIALAGLLAGLAQLRPRLFSWQPLYLLGQHSLQVFTGHIFVIYGIFLWKDTFQAGTPWLQWGMGGAAVGMLFVFAYLHRWHESTPFLSRPSQRPIPSGSQD
jgi:hypothetical protein